MQTDAELEDLYDVVILHSEAEKELALNLRESIRTIQIEGNEPLKVKILEELSHCGMPETLTLDHIIMRTTVLMFFCSEEFSSDQTKTKTFAWHTSLYDRITHLKPERHWTVIPLYFNDTKRHKLAPCIKGLFPLKIFSNGQLIESSTENFRKLFPKKLRQLPSSTSISSLSLEEDRTEEGRQPSESTPVTNKEKDDDELRRQLDRLKAINTPDDHPDNSMINTHYKMDSFPRGYFLIINNEHFKKNPGLEKAKVFEDRIGTYYDKKLMIETFLHLGFEIQALDDLTAKEMKRIFRTYGKRDHSRYDCFACCILTHGGSGVVYGVDGLPVTIEEIEDPFRSTCCPTLAGKPKLFFIQACRGAREQRGYPSKSKADAPSTECLDYQSNIKTDAPSTGENPVIPDKADFFFGFSTVDGHNSFREDDEGTWFITQLAVYLKKFAHKEDIHAIFVYINEAVSNLSKKDDDGALFVQVSEQKSTLKRKLLFPLLSAP